MLKKEARSLASQIASQVERHLNEQDRKIQQVHETLQRLDKSMNSLDVSIEHLLFYGYLSQRPLLLATNVCAAEENQRDDQGLGRDEGNNVNAFQVHPLCFWCASCHRMCIVSLLEITSRAQREEVPLNIGYKRTDKNEEHENHFFETDGDGASS